MNDAADGGLSLGSGAQLVLDALEGVSYLTAPDGTILAVGQPGWDDFAASARTTRVQAGRVIGEMLFSFVSGAEVRQVQMALHDQVVSRAKSRVTFDYRCDGPDTERRMRMSLTPVLRDAKIVGVLYQSIILEQFSRPRIGLFDQYDRVADTYNNGQVLKVCSYCHDVAWPVPRQPETYLWIEPEDYYRRGGTSDVLVSHGICPVCYDRMLPSRRVKSGGVARGEPEQRALSDPYGVLMRWVTL